jgi:NAD(P)-dependent dehydrogenase (short-subunit alcohol dehydrogenase family)
MNLDLNEKVIVVTGGARGIGAAIVRALAAEGAIPVIVSLSHDNDAESLLMELQRNHYRAYFIETNLAESQNCQQAVAETVKTFGRIDGLVNNAGTNDEAGLASGSPERFLQSLRVNLLHYFCMAHYALPHLKQSRGVIVNISSKVAETGQGNTSGYAAAKGGVNALTREWAVELLPFGIRVNCVIPAEVWTPMYEQWINSFADREEKLQTIISRIPLGNRMTTADEIAAMVVFLLSEKSAHTTGQLIHVDGGYVHLDRSVR